MHHIDANKTDGGARRQLHKNVASNIEQVQAATSHKHQLYSHLSPITKTIQVKRTRHAGHCWGSRDELIRDVILWTPTYGRAKAGRPARTYLQQLCEDTGCSPEDLPEAMNHRKKWRERVRDIRASDDDDDDIFIAGEYLSSFFFHTYNLSISSLGCKALCFIISIFVFWSFVKVFPYQEWSLVS